MAQTVYQITPILDRSIQAAAVVKSKKHSDKALYTILVDCLRVVELCCNNPIQQSALQDRFEHLPKLPGQKRMYVERNSDLYQRVCRVVFHGVEHPNNINRYAIALREAVKIDETSATLMTRLMEKGGVHRLWLRRPKTSMMVRTRTLYLQRQIEHSKAAEFSLTFKLRKDGSYQVTNLDGCRYGVI